MSKIDTGINHKSQRERFSKLVKFYTLGCKVNQYETQSIRENFLKKQYKEVKQGKADIYVINTCTVTQTADRKSREYIYRCLRENPKSTIIVTGCYVQKDRDLISKINGIDFIIPNEMKNKITDIIISQKEKLDFTEDNKYQDLKISNFANHSRAFVKIQDGCNNSCSYCKIPLVRGRSRSRDLSSIIQEVSRLINNGFKEIVLTGICLGEYGREFKERIELVDVIEELEKLEGEFRIRLSSIEAKDIDDRLIQKFSKSKKLCRHLHIPFQSGDDEILRLMNRKYTVSFYKEVIKKVRSYIPQIAITTDILVGFPYETQRRFQNTINFLKEISPSRIHIFPFSPRQQTLAYSLPNRIDSATVRIRIRQLQNLAKEKSFEYRKQFLNKDLMVLIEDKTDRQTGLPTGYSDNYIKILLINEKGALARKLLRVRLIKVTSDFTLAKLQDNS
jgi:threonylcarbamoyladenosine tRNA methylthiotransferase MtaB